MIKLLESEALQLHFRLETLDINHYVVERNYQDLRKFLLATESPDAFPKLWVVGKKQELNLAMAEVTRLLLNLITSAKARTQNTRKLMYRWYKDHRFLNVYQEQVDVRFKDVPIVLFIEDLRNYSYHYSLPLAGAAWEITSPSEGNPVLDQAFTLDKGELLKENYAWEKGRAFLEESNEDIRIKELTAAYFTIIQGFHVWMMNHLKAIHKEDLEWLYDTNKVVQDAFNRAFPEAPAEPSED